MIFMSSNPQLENLEQAFYSDGYKLGMKAGGAEKNSTLIFSAIQEMYAAIDDFIESLFDFAKQQNQPIECKKGCEWCCHQPVFAMDYELDFLNNYLDKSLSKEELRKTKQKAKEKQQKLESIEKDALLNAKYPCPLLRNGLCIAYEVRPMACRIYLSTDLKTCLRFYDKPHDTSNYPALLELPMRAGRMMNEGFKAALKTFGFDSKEFRIEERLN